MDFRFLKMPAFRTDLHMEINVAQGSVLSQSRTSAVRPSFSAIASDARAFGAVAVARWA